ncbi:hypothetical protein O6H91_Y382400 [Diphasiastrum complanatum]|nr:hypothetical protein O6H91_Y382400 [Diphasiastrum complanatum]
MHLGRDRLLKQKMLTHFNSLSKGWIPNSGPNPGHNDATTWNKKVRSNFQYRLQAEDHKLSMSSIPRGANKYSGSNPKQHDMLDKVSLVAQDKLDIQLISRGKTTGSNQSTS